MITTSAVSLAIGLALLAAGVIVALAKTQHREAAVRQDVVRLRAGDAADHMIPGQPGQPGDDGQFGRWYLPNIRRERDAERGAETQASQGNHRDHRTH